MKFWQENKEHVYWNPYFGGFMLGLLIILTFYINGRGVGATSDTGSVVAAAVETTVPGSVARSGMYAKYYNDEENPMKNWLMFETIGILAGAFLSGALSGRTKFRIQHPPHIKAKKRLIWAAVGGLLFGLGSQIAMGCTTGAALSRMAILSLGGFITLIVLFATAYLAAYFFRKLWIN